MATLSPGLQTVSMAAIIASVAPQVIVICLSGSRGRLMRVPCFSAKAVRRRTEPGSELLLPLLNEECGSPKYSGPVDIALRPHRSGLRDRECRPNPPEW